MESTGIYLDEPFTNALIVRGYNEGLIPSYMGGDSDYERSFLSRFANPRYSATALNNLVLYDKVYLNEYFDNFVLDDLIEEGVLEVPFLDRPPRAGPRRGPEPVPARVAAAPSPRRGPTG